MSDPSTARDPSALRAPLLGSVLELDLPEELHGLLEHAILASRRDPFDPMERALHEAGDRLIKDTEHLHPGW